MFSSMELSGASCFQMTRNPTNSAPEGHRMPGVSEILVFAWQQRGQNQIAYDQSLKSLCLTRNSLAKKNRIYQIEGGMKHRRLKIQQGLVAHSCEVLLSSIKVRRETPSAQGDPWGSLVCIDVHVFFATQDEKSTWPSHIKFPKFLFCSSFQS